MKRVVKWFVIGSMVWGVLLACVLSVSASEQAGGMGSASQAGTQTAVDLRPEAWPEPGQEDDTEGGAVLDSGNPDDLPVEPDEPITSQQVAAAVLEIRTSVVFFVFGVIPLLSAVVFLYLFFRWVYRLIISVI